MKLYRYSPTWRGGIFALLFPALLLLPTLHLHPAYEHEYRTGGAHKHRSIVHTDFLPSSAYDHGEHHQNHGTPDHASPQPLSQISFPTLLPRSLVFSLLALERVLGSLPVEAPVLSSPFSFHTWILTRDHAPPAQTFAFSPISPRSPPHTA
jgi:hypothetical protein